MAAVQRFSFWHALYLSFFSKEFYQDVGRRWPGVGLVYLFFLLALAWLPLMLKLHVGMQSFARDQAPKIIQQLPRITITKGVVETDPPGRHEIKDADGKTFLIIDASMETLNLDELPSDVALLTRTKLVIKQSDRRQSDGGDRHPLDEELRTEQLDNAAQAICRRRSQSLSDSGEEHASPWSGR